MKRGKGNVAKRNIVLKMETYNRLQKFLVELVREKGSPRVSFDEAVNRLLDEHKGRSELSQLPPVKTGGLPEC